MNNPFGNEIVDIYDELLNVSLTKILGITFKETLYAECEFTINGEFVFKMFGEYKAN